MCCLMMEPERFTQHSPAPYGVLDGERTSVGVPRSGGAGVALVVGVRVGEDVALGAGVSVAVGRGVFVGVFVMISK